MGDEGLLYLSVIRLQYPASIVKSLMQLLSRLFGTSCRITHQCDTAAERVIRPRQLPECHLTEKTGD